MKNVLWYYNHNLKPQGPFSLEEMRERIHRGDIGPQSLISNNRDNVWKPACEHEDFEVSLFPATQGYVHGLETGDDEKEWVLLVPSLDGKSVLQEGPFSLSDLRAGLQAKSISQQQYIWKTGLSGWCRIQDRPELSGST